MSDELDELVLNGKATDNIWAMEHTIDGESMIGLRVDCGDAGTLYLTKVQAKEVIDTLNQMIGESASASPEVPRPGCTLCGQEMIPCYRCTNCGSISGCTPPVVGNTAPDKETPSEADLARIAVRHFPVKLESQLGIVKKDVNAEGRAACLAALREACGMEVPNG